MAARDGGNVLSLGDIQIKSHALFQDRSGRFISKVMAGAATSANEIAKAAEEYAKTYAPIDLGSLRASISARASGATSAIVTATSPHALFQEEGTRAHAISTVKGAMVNKRKGFRAYRPSGSTEGERWSIQHPGNPATHFLARGAASAAAEATEIIRRNMP